MFYIDVKVNYITIIIGGDSGRVFNIIYDWIVWIVIRLRKLNKT